jgi:hypothetical protein
MNFLKRCWKKRWLRRLTWTAATLVTLYALLCAWMNWSGARQWRAMEAMLKAEGETLDFRETLYEPVPEEENFCAIPLLKDLALDTAKDAQSVNRKRLETIRKLPYGMQSFTDPIAGTRADLQEWADSLRKEGSLPMPADSGDAAHDVLAALSKYDSIVQELAAGLHRTKARWTPECKTRGLSPMRIFDFPPITMMFLCCRLLDMRAVAAVHAGDATGAHEAALIMARFSQAYMNEPLVICLMVSGIGARKVHCATWELCAAHAGTSGNFARLESSLAALDYERALLHTVRSEMAGMTDVVRAMKSWRGDHRILASFKSSFARTSTLGAISDRAIDMFTRAIPAGLFDANATVLAELEFRHIIKPLKEHGWKGALASAKDLQNELRALEKWWAHPSGIMAGRLGLASWHVIFEFIYTQTLVKQAVIACALERHRIEHGSYPDSLDAVRLTDGQPLPPDPMDGKPMRYRKTTDGRYVFWSIGHDGKDDGGKRIFENSDPKQTSFQFPGYVGDWVWDLPAE